MEIKWLRFSICDNNYRHFLLLKIPYETFMTLFTLKGFYSRLWVRN